MDNLTHSLVGLAAAKAGLERVSPGATALCVIAANAPDADVVTLFAGQFAYLEHHRGITHSLAGTLTIALVLPLVFYAADRLVARLGSRPPRAKFSGLLVASLILSATHPLLDYTNNYGVRPLLPWDARWFYGDLVFIMDPWIWLILGGACFLLTSQTSWGIAVWTILALVSTVFVFLLPQRFGFASPLVLWLLWLSALAALMLARRAHLAALRDSRLAALALALVAVYWGALALAHARAFRQAQSVARDLAATRGENLMRVAVMPSFANPFEWASVAETDRAMLRFSVSLGGGDDVRPEAVRRAERFEKPQGEASALVTRAAADPRARIFLNFSRFPAMHIQRGCMGDAIVQFADLRFTEPGSRQRGSFSLDVPVSSNP